MEVARHPVYRPRVIQIQALDVPNSTVSGCLIRGLLVRLRPTDRGEGLSFFAWSVDDHSNLVHLHGA
jgi:hypothetical protein